MLHQRIFEHVAEAVAHIDEEWIGIQFPDLPSNKKTPLMLGVYDLRHFRLLRQHFYLAHVLRLHFVGRMK